MALVLDVIIMYPVYHFLVCLSRISRSTTVLTDEYATISVPVSMFSAHAHTQLQSAVQDNPV